MLDTTIHIGTLELKNRLVMPPMQTNKTIEGHVTDELIDYYRERAAYSAPGLIITEHCCIAKNGRASLQQLSMADDGMIAEHRRLTEAIHRAGSRVFIQLNHAGSNGIDEPVSASDVAIPTKKTPAVPRPLTAEEIRGIEALFAEGAIRAVKAGYDGVELHCAHAYLLNQFYSPLTNKRTDDYGGSIENRLRFLTETVKKVKEAVKGALPVAVRLGGADYLPGGSEERDAAAAAKLLEAEGVDLLDVSGGMCFYSRPGHTEPGYFSSMTKRIKEAVSTPVLLTGGIKRLEDAERLLQEGKADMIGVGRALLMDAHWRENA